MLFNSPVFLFFFILVFWIYNYGIGSGPYRQCFLIAVSLVFYASFKWVYALLFVATVTIDYILAISIFRKRNDSVFARKSLLVASFVMNIGLLCGFKLAPLLSGSRLSALVIPVGFSFYTLQSLAYLVDVYRGEVERPPGYGEFVTAVSFFPHLLAGPILKAENMIRQIRENRRLTVQAFRTGLWWIAIGLTKKTIADHLAVPVDAMMADPSKLTSLGVITAAIGYIGQVFCDFSGYADMAMGLGKLLGFELPRNFYLSGLSVSPAEFWRRWNITLGRWLGDYVYRPLGGRKHQHVRNLVVTILLAALWHGFGICFLIFGLYNAVAVLISHRVQSFAEKSKLAEWSMFATPVLIFFNQFYTLIPCALLFRAPSFQALSIMVSRLFSGQAFTASGPLAWETLLIFVLAYAFSHVLDALSVFEEKVTTWNALFFPMICILFGVNWVFSRGGRDFIYFQF